MLHLSNLASIRYYLPDIAVTATIVILLFVHCLRKNPRGNPPAYIAIAGLVVAFFLSLYSPGDPPRSLFEGMIAIDPFAVFVKTLCTLSTIIGILIAIEAKELERRGSTEFCVFMLTITLGMYLLTTATDFVTLYMGLELVSIPSYLLAGYLVESRRGNEAAVKYVVYGACASGMMIYGFSLLHGLSGSTHIADAGRALITGKAAPPLMVLAVVLVTVGFAYKIAAVPFHMWCPDVYEGAPIPVAAFLSVGPKAAGFAVLIRFYYTVFSAPDPALNLWKALAVDWTGLFAWLAAATMTVGNLVALRQENVKRLLAYSSIAHAGFMMMGVIALSPEGIHAVLFYLAVYLAMNFGAFAVVLFVANATGGREDLASFRGLGTKAPLAAFVMAIFLFSLVGLPPFGGFIAKIYVFAETINRKLYWLAIVGGINSVVALFYYARIIKTMYFEEPEASDEIAVSPVFRVVFVALAVVTVALGIYWRPLTDAAERASRIIAF